MDRFNFSKIGLKMWHSMLVTRENEPLRMTKYPNPPPLPPNHPNSMKFPNFTIEQKKPRT